MFRWWRPSCPSNDAALLDHERTALALRPELHGFDLLGDFLLRKHAQDLRVLSASCADELEERREQLTWNASRADDIGQGVQWRRFHTCL